MSQQKPNPGRFDIKHIIKSLNLTESDLKEKVILKQKEDVFYLVLNNKVNAFTHEILRTINDKLDEVEQHDGPTALVTVGLHSKFYSTGINLNMMKEISTDKMQLYLFLTEFIMLFERFLQLSVPTIACVNGHAYAGGLMFAFSHDYVFMRNDFGQLCLTEIELGMYLPPGMNSVIQQRTGNTPQFREMVLQAKRFTPEDAFKYGWLDNQFDPEILFDKVSEYAQNVAKFGENKKNYQKLKKEMNRYAIKQCSKPHFDFTPKAKL